MTKKTFKIVILLILICCFMVAGAVTFMLYMPHRNIQHETPVIISSTELTDAYQKNETEANFLFLDKVLQVTGTVNSFETNGDGQIVLNLSGSTPISGVRCTLQEKQLVDIGQTITIKGRCTGYLSDVIIIDCLIIK